MVKAQTPLVDVLVRPRVMASNTFDFTRVEEFIAEGQRAAREALPALDRIRALTK